MKRAGTSCPATRLGTAWPDAIRQRAERDTAVEGIGHRRRVVGAVVEDVVGDLRPGV